ncbi:4Fe-4S dicluster domain-containing protein [Thermodesulfatator autotrophicus]|uniref:4Fe-4S ferredoxin-type domain-containing protein n=1 Tax=Thermodesulfatator autotrophicus TaxID=1795632 RepID=A0A177E4X0_9BACT|nr:4Fe-4S dicluster domain-containing protein [Thermodesulfatator autotrophicus]OAG26766.1 hypothetical protein TH606_10560 [Thermodesulfatator autotrophicus]
MNSLTFKLREKARQILKEGQAEAILAFTEGPTPFKPRLALIKSPEEAERIVWPGFSGLNPLTLWPKIKDIKTAIFATGCISRTLAVLIKEKQLEREEIYVVGVPCPGLLDPQKIPDKPEIKKIDEKEEKIFFETQKETKVFLRRELLRETCLSCRHPSPTLYDEILEGESLTPSKIPFSRVEELEKLSSEERAYWFFEKIVSPCIRCYACRNACPLCYCPQCFVDDSRPQWVGKTRDPIDNLLYHLVRAFHLAGRCVNCGSCEAACPLGLPLQVLNQKLIKEAFENFTYEAGLDLESPLLFDTYDEKDPDDFIVTAKRKTGG